MYIWEEIEQLSNAELFNLLSEYDKYVIEVCDRQDGSIPVCVVEFYENDYPLIIEAKENEEYCPYCKNTFDKREGHSCWEKRSGLMDLKK